MVNFVKVLTSIGVNKGAAEIIGAKIVGAGAALNAESVGGYMNPNVIDGYSFNPSDGNWYKPSLFDGKFDFSSPVGPELRENLNQQRYWRDVQNRVENVGPANGDAGAITAPSLFKLLKNFPEIFDRYREIAKDSFVPGDFDINGISYDTNGNVISGLITKGQDPSEIIESLQTIFTQAEKTRSPLILDLDGLNGVETLGKTSGIHFDHDGNKFAEQSGWVGQNDGMLVWDKNGNGQIDNGTELFGNNTALKNGSKADNGFTALADLDSNKDGKVDANDAASRQLRVFKDANSNGVVDAGELLTLAQAGVKSLNTGYTTQAVTDANGNQHLQAGSFTTTSGQNRAMDDVWFAVDTARTVDKDLVAVNSTIAALPDLAGFGNVHTLHQAMARDASGKLQALVQQYAATKDPAVRAGLPNDIVYRWAGVQDIDPASRAATMIYGNAIGDARKLATLETFLGESYLGTWCWGTRDPNPHGQAAPVLLSAYDQLAQWVDRQLLAQSLYRPMYESIGLSWNADSQNLEWDVSAVVAILKAQYSADPLQGQALLAGFVDNLKIMDEAGKQIRAELERQGHKQGQEFLTLMDYADRGQVTGTAGADNLYAKTNSGDFMISGSGNDTLYGGAGADVLLGNAGADKLDGSAGSDTYLWFRGDGNDTINDLGLVADVDTLKLLDVKAAEVQLSRDALNLYVTIGAEKITIKNHFSTLSYEAAPIEQILFADGGKLQKADFDAAPYRGGDSADAIYGTAASETFIGGKGADILYGSTGSDSYFWSKGEGNDTINDLGLVADVDTLKLLDVKTAEVQLSRDSVNLYVAIGAEKITIKNHFSTLSYEAAPIEQILFADGGKWQKAELGAAPYRGGDGVDTIYGTTAAETFIGGKGADVLYGSAGSDSYIWSKGEGNDTINDVGLAADVDTLKLLNVKATEVQLSRDSVNLYVTIGTEKLTIKNHFSTLSYEAAPIEQIQFADGGKWLKADFDAAPYRGTAARDTIYGTAQAEIFIGGAEADILVGGAGGDVYQLARGDGADTIREYDATAGNTDVLQFMAGISASQLWFRKIGNDLEASVIGTGDKAIVQDWYLGNPYHVEQIKSGDGKLLQDTQVDKLVQAMAGFTPPAMGQTALTAAQQTALAPVLAANWH
jgi:Ca2+-binding RTX toxin-like protein